jgi:hypothetical protein
MVWRGMPLLIAALLFFTAILIPQQHNPSRRLMALSLTPTRRFIKQEYFADQVWISWLPALKARNLPAPTLFKIASAMIERAELPVQRNSTLKG